MDLGECCWGDPSFRAPFPVMQSLVSAACERMDAISSNFHESCVSSGMQALVEENLTEMLACDTVEEIPFKEIKKEYTFDPVYGGYRTLSFMHRFDGFLWQLLGGYGCGYDVRYYTDKTGAIEYNTLPDLASALSEPLIAPEWIYWNDDSVIKADVNLQVLLNAKWASQRMRMLNLLRYIRVYNGGVILRSSYPENDGWGTTPQNAYDSIQSRNMVDYTYFGFEEDIGCRVWYWDTQFSDPEEQWVVENEWSGEIAEILPDFHGCAPAEHGELTFDAVAPVDDWYWDFEAKFDPLCTNITSGAQTLTLSGGSFASWGYGSASTIGGEDTPYGKYIRGWQAQNVKVIFDYESTFQFKQEE
jgi:hypothetical protein